MYALDNQLNYYKLECEKLKQENARLREALEIYATRTNWSYGEIDDDYGDIVFKYNSNDGYYFAQKALEQSDAK